MDKTPSELGISNLVSAHEHVYELKGGPTWWAECVVRTSQSVEHDDGGASVTFTTCGHKFNRGNGVVCGSRDKVRAALKAQVNA